MSFKKKLDNYLYYYKYHTIIGLIIVLLASYYYFTASGNKQSDFNIVLFSINNPFADLNIKQDLDDLIVSDKNKKEVKISFLPFDVSDQNSQASMMSFQALAVWVSAQDVDILMANEEIIKNYSIDEEGKSTYTFVPLNEYKIDSVKSLEDNDKNKIALLVSDLKRLKNIEFFDKDLYISIVSNGKNKDKAEKVINYLLN